MSSALYPEWMEHAACRGATGMFFPESGENADQAKRICADCPVQTDCLQLAIDENIQHGIWGGLTVRERRNLRNGLPVGTPRCKLPPIDHGTEKGYRQHRLRGVEMCRLCSEAHSGAVQYRKHLRLIHTVRPLDSDTVERPR